MSVDSDTKKRRDTDNDIESNTRTSIITPDTHDTYITDSRNDIKIYDSSLIESNQQEDDIRACVIAMKKYTHTNSYSLCERITDQDIEKFISSFY